jgi:hypothetical protein
MNEEHTLSLEELGEIKTVKVYNQAYADKQQERIEQLEKENAELKEKSKRQSNNYKHDVDMLIEDNKYKIKVCKELAHQANAIQDNLAKAKNLLLRFIELKNKPCAVGHSVNMLLYENIRSEAEQFLKEVSE